MAKSKINDKVFDMVKSSDEEINLKQDKIDKHIQKARNIRKEYGKGRPNLDKEGNIVNYSTHKMQTEIGEALIELGVVGPERGKWYSFPTLFPHKTKRDRWVDYGGGQDKKYEGRGSDLAGAYLQALSRDEVFEFDEDKESAIKFGEGSWKSEE